MSTPWASGDQTIWEMPSRSHSGITSASGARHSIEYCGWLDTHLAIPSRASEASIFSAGHDMGSSEAVAERTPGPTQHPTYGIHGSPDPTAIGKHQSHGCVRLTNWDAVELGKAVKKGVPVDFVGQDRALGAKA